MARFLLLATHHKTGTVWMRDLFRGIADRLGGTFIRLPAGAPVDLAPLQRQPPPVVLFQDHGRFGPLDLAQLDQSGDARGLHIVRDPRDVLISGAHYHSWSHEGWLHRPRPDFGGRSYQETIRELPFADAVRFEMRHSTGRAVRDMLSFEARGLFRDVRYEDLLEDSAGERAAMVFTALGFGPADLPVCVELYRTTHARRAYAGGSPLRHHVQSLDVERWRYLFDLPLLRDFARAFGDAPERLGYRPSEPEALVADEVRKTAFLARLAANQGRIEDALAMLDAVLARRPRAARLALLREAITKAA